MNDRSEQHSHTHEHKHNYFLHSMSKPKCGSLAREIFWLHISLNVFPMCTMWFVSLCVCALLLCLCKLLCKIWKHVSEHFDVNNCSNVGWFIEVTGAILKTPNMPDDANKYIATEYSPTLFHHLFSIIIYYCYIFIFFPHSISHSKKIMLEFL